ncbi:MarR family transcriptional repressor of emrRAB [Mycobacterium frederiksbergense]|uniref:MarR family transcriptional repressor of emrRAB n=1 Tax=Mycolicibacterium frederiksbergense TaxID=117567 RepID=A0ABT6L3D6_9MYCO|nr:MarR family transcriptional regulator [Mycolicibacterium frederiksbergense]MDH6197445.1 MarR family transcriptional repressor of emrRAB [Mycolicibacterium frederiksbergense]
MNGLVGAKLELLLSRIGDDEAGRLVMAVLATARRIDAACADILSRYDISEGRLAALLAVSADPGVAPGALADRLEVTRATVTGLLDGLERRGLIQRGGNAGDRRSLTLRTTPLGEHLIATLTPLYADWLHHLETGIGADEHATVLRTMAVIQHNISEEPSR